MSDESFAKTPEPPYYVAIFTSRLRPEDADGYRATAERMVELASARPGFLGMESVRDAAGFGITLSYWESEAAIAGWRADAEHREARHTGRSDWYARYELRVGRVERARSWTPADGNTE